jgi:hypothetical protein
MSRSFVLGVTVMSKEDEDSFSFGDSLASAMLASPLIALSVFLFVGYVLMLIGGLL